MLSHRNSSLSAALATLKFEECPNNKNLRPNYMGRLAHMHVYPRGFVFKLMEDLAKKILMYTFEFNILTFVCSVYCIKDWGMHLKDLKKALKLRLMTLTLILGCESI